MGGAKERMIRSVWPVLLALTSEREMIEESKGCSKSSPPVPAFNPRRCLAMNHRWSATAIRIDWPWHCWQLFKVPSSSCMMYIRYGQDLTSCWMVKLHYKIECSFMQGRVFDKLLLLMLNRKKIIEEPIWKFHMQTNLFLSNKSVNCGNVIQAVATDCFRPVWEPVKVKCFVFQKIQYWLMVKIDKLQFLALQLSILSYLDVVWN